MPLPFSRLQCHTRRGSDLCFVNSPVVLATAGLSHGHGAAGSSICLWDALLPPSQALVGSCSAHADGARCVLHCIADSSLVSGGERGDLAIFDLRQRRIRKHWQAHTMAVQALALSPRKKFFFSASADSDIMLWDLDDPCHHTPATESLNSGLASSSVSPESHTKGHWPQAHEPNALLAPLVAKLRQSGINTLQWSSQPASLISGGCDGKVKLWTVR